MPTVHKWQVPYNSQSKYFCLKRQQHFFWALSTQTSLSKDSHIRCPWQWAETRRGCYPQISGGTRFASIYSISLVKTGQLSGKSSMTTAIPVQQYQNGHLIFLHHQKKSHLRTQESSPRMFSLSSQHHPLVQKPLSCHYQALVQYIPREKPLRKQVPPLSLNEVWVTFMGHPTKSTLQQSYSVLCVLQRYLNSGKNSQTYGMWPCFRGFSVLLRADTVFIYVLYIQRT